MDKFVSGTLTLLACACLTLGGGCGDDDNATENNNNAAGDDAGVDAGPDASAGERVEIIILDGTDSDNIGEDASAIPVADAMVAFDLPGGERVERTTGADGRVTIYGVDWSQGSAAMTAYKDGYGMVSFVNLEANDLDATENPFLVIVDGAVAMYLMDLSPTPPPEITVTGTATRMADSSHNYTVSTLRSLVATTWSGSGSAAFEVTAPLNEPFTLQAIEMTPIGVLPSGQGNDVDIHRAMELNLDPTAGPTLSVELDFFADEIPVYTADASMVLPARADSPLRDGIPYFLVGATDNVYTIGWGTPVDVSADGNSFGGTVSWVEPTLITEPYIYFMVNHTLSGARSVAIEPGYPQGGMLDPPLYDVPRWVTPSDPQTEHPMHDPMAWDLFDDWTVALLIISRSGIDIWRVNAGSGATSLTIPQPPSAVDQSSFLGPTFQAQLIGGLRDPDEDRFDRYVDSPTVRLSR